MDERNFLGRLGVSSPRELSPDKQRRFAEVMTVIDSHPDLGGRLLDRLRGEESESLRDDFGRRINGVLDS